ncbi:MAG: hypothetical protein Q9202_006196 [Teloschistes flavicans]
MDNLDGSDHYSKTTDEPTPSLLTIILDTHPAAWSLLSPTLPLSTALAHILVFINAHLACNNSNEVCIIAAHPHRAEFLYPCPPTPSAAPSTNGHTGGPEPSNDDGSNHNNQGQDSANTYRPFRLVQRTLLRSLDRLLATTPASSSFATPTVALSGALTLALTYTNRLLTSLSTKTPSATSIEPNTLNPASNPSATAGILNARILLISLTSNLSAQYIPLTNTIFACSRLGIPISVAKISSSNTATHPQNPRKETQPTPAPPNAEDATFLQQASDSTRGIYLPIHHPGGLLQYLMMAFLPDQSTSLHLSPGIGDQGVDFRAACFCHRRVVDVGFVCSVCLSIFCEPPDGAVCLTCGTQLKLGNYGQKPVVVARKKKKRKNRLDANGDVASGAGTPVR